VPLQIDNRSHLSVHAFVSRFPQPLGRADTPAHIAVLLRDATATCELARADDKLRTSVRDALRKQGFKPTGRSKPSSEYLLRAREEGALRSINLAVDAGNVASLHSGLPISVIDLDLVSGPLYVRCADAGENYVFNPSGQVLALGGLPCLYDVSGPCANAVKDAQRTKTSEATQNTLNIIWSSHGLETRTEETLRLYKSLLSGLAELESIQVQTSV